MQPPFWLNAAPRPIPVLPNSCMGGLHLAKRGAAFINFLKIIYYYYYKRLCHLEKPSLAAFGGFTTVGICAVYIYSYVASCMQYIPIARPSHKRGR